MAILAQVTSAYTDLKDQFDWYASQVCYTDIDAQHTWHITGLDHCSAFITNASDGAFYVLKGSNMGTLPPLGSLPSNSHKTLKDLEAHIGRYNTIRSHCMVDSLETVLQILDSGFSAHRSTIPAPMAVSRETIKSTSHSELYSELLRLQKGFENFASQASGEPILLERLRNVHVPETNCNAYIHHSVNPDTPFSYTILKGSLISPTYGKVKDIPTKSRDTRYSDRESTARQQLMALVDGDGVLQQNFPMHRWTAAHNVVKGYRGGQEFIRDKFPTIGHRLEQLRAVLLATTSDDHGMPDTNGSHPEPHSAPNCINAFALALERAEKELKAKCEAQVHRIRTQKEEQIGRLRETIMNNDKEWSDKLQSVLDLYNTPHPHKEPQPSISPESLPSITEVPQYSPTRVVPSSIESPTGSIVLHPTIPGIELEDTDCTEHHEGDHSSCSSQLSPIIPGIELHRPTSLENDASFSSTVSEQDHNYLYIEEDGKDENLHIEEDEDGNLDSLPQSEGSHGPDFAYLKGLVKDMSAAHADQLNTHFAALKSIFAEISLPQPLITSPPTSPAVPRATSNLGLEESPNTDDEGSDGHGDSGEHGSQPSINELVAAQLLSKELLRQRDIYEASRQDMLTSFERDRDALQRSISQVCAERDKLILLHQKEKDGMRKAAERSKQNLQRELDKARKGKPTISQEKLQQQISKLTEQASKSEQSHAKELADVRTQTLVEMVSLKDRIRNLELKLVSEQQARAREVIDLESYYDVEALIHQAEYQATIKERDADVQRLRDASSESERENVNLLYKAKQHSDFVELLTCRVSFHPLDNSDSWCQDCIAKQKLRLGNLIANGAEGEEFDDSPQEEGISSPLKEKQECINALEYRLQQTLMVAEHMQTACELRLQKVASKRESDRKKFEKGLEIQAAEFEADKMRCQEEYGKLLAQLQHQWQLDTRQQIESVRKMYSMLGVNPNKESSTLPAADGSTTPQAVLSPQAIPQTPEVEKTEWEIMRAEMAVARAGTDVLSEPESTQAFSTPTSSRAVSEARISTPQGLRWNFGNPGSALSAVVQKQSQRDYNFPNIQI